MFATEEMSLISSIHQRPEESYLKEQGIFFPPYVSCFAKSGGTKFGGTFPSLGSEWGFDMLSRATYLHESINMSKFMF